MGLDDLAMMRAITGATVLDPSDAVYSVALLDIDTLRRAAEETRGIVTVSRSPCRRALRCARRSLR